MTGEEVEEVPPLDEPDLRVLQGLGVGDVDPLVEEGRLPHDLPRTDDLEDLFLPAQGPLDQLHPSGEDEVKAEGRCPLLEDDLLAAILDPLDQPLELFQVLGAQVGKDPEIR